MTKVANLHRIIQEALFSESGKQLIEKDERLNFPRKTKKKNDGLGILGLNPVIFLPLVELIDGSEQKKKRSYSSPIPSFPRKT